MTISSPNIFQYMRTFESKAHLIDRHPKIFSDSEVKSDAVLEWQ